MKACALPFFAALFALFLCSCGSLDRNIASEKLSKEDIAYANSLPSDSGHAMLQGFDKFKIQGSQRASRFDPYFPWFYLKSFFKDDQNKGYGLLELYAVMPVVPLFAGVDGSIYDNDGMRLYAFHSSGMPIVYSYSQMTEFKTSFPDGKYKEWRFDLLAFPYINGCVSFGNKSFQFLWIPIISPAADRNIVKNLDMGYSCGEEFNN